MSIKKVGKRLISGLIAGMILISSSGVYAADAIRLGATLWRENTEKRAVANTANSAGITGEENLIAYEASNTGSEELRAWKLVEQTGDVTTINYEKAIYCLKAGVGFTGMLDANTYTATGVDYNKKYNMYDKEQIKTAMGWDDETYNRVLWIVDNMYIKNVSTTAMDDLLKSVVNSDSESIYDRMNATETNLDDLTQNDIEVIQQMAIWYFTNADDEKYHKINDTTGEPELPTLTVAMKSSLSEIPTDPTELRDSFDTFADLYNTQIGQQSELLAGTHRQEYAEELYKYLISQAEANEEDYTHTDNGVTATFWTHVDAEGNITTGEDARQPVVIIERPNFDLALRKYITTVSDGKTYKNTYYRVPEIKTEQLQKLANGDITTVEKKHDKTPVAVHTGDIVTYTIRIYNEGDIAGYANEVTDYLPAGLEFIPASESTINNQYKWKCYDGKTVTTDYLSSNDNLINAFDKENLTLDYVDLQIECRVIEENSTVEKKLRNAAEITKAKDEAGNDMLNVGDDRDSTPKTLANTVITNPNTYNSNTPDEKGTGSIGWGYEDDDDYDDLVLPVEEIDLALRKFITAVGDAELVDEYGNYLREPEVLTSTIEATKTATYNHTKVPVTVAVGDIVTYTIRVYNEGDVDAYVSEITDYLPEWLEFLPSDEQNLEYLWSYDEPSRAVITNITASDVATGTVDENDIYGTRENGKLLKAWDGTENKLDYIDVKIRCKVIDTVGENKLQDGTKITNIAEITEMTDASGNNVPADRDSQVENLNRPTDEELPEYKKDQIGIDEYIPGQQDDDDFEKVVVQVFDMALRKFITDVEGSPVNNRYPVPTFDESLNRLVYNHPKTPVEVEYGDIVTYTIRVYNEGTIDGYIEEITDDLPEYLTFLPDNEINKQYGWVMRDEFGVATDDLEDAVCITTDYLSKANEATNGKVITIDNGDGTFQELKSSLIKAFDKDATVDELNPDYREVKVAMRVDLQITGDNMEDINRILINEAQISEDADKDGLPVEDIDSDPERDDKYNYEGDNEDDIDYEPVKVKYFDLALKKWVTQSIVTENGKTTVTESGHTGDEYPEPPMKVELRSKYLKTSTVKFRFKIKVTNEGEIAGYATEVTDHIPEGLEFIASDNPEWYERGDGLVATDALKNTLLQPGESATVEIVLTWIKANDNFGLKTNYAEISQDDNASNSPDIDSDPDNFTGKIIEDDEDEAPVVLSIKTGEMPMYFILTTTIMAMLVGGVLLIKKYVI